MAQISTRLHLFPYKDSITAPLPKPNLWITQHSIQKYFSTTQDVKGERMCDVKLVKERHMDWMTEANSSPSDCDGEIEAAKVSIGVSTEEMCCEPSKEEFHKIDLETSLGSYGVSEICIQTDLFDESRSTPQTNSKEKQAFISQNFRINKILKEDRYYKD